MPETLFTIEEVAEMLKVKPITVRRLIADGQIETVRVGRQIRISESAYNKYVQENTGKR